VREVWVVTTPSELLVAAADRIRDLAAAATHGRWEAQHWDVRARIFTPKAMEEAAASRRFGGALALARLLCPELVEEDQK
jgi:hypothetical protein